MATEKLIPMKNNSARPTSAPTQTRDPFNISGLMSGLEGTGQTEEIEKQKGKNAESLAKLQGEIQQRLQQQQLAMQQSLQQQQLAMQMQLQQQNQQWRSPFEAAGLTGYYNGQMTLANTQFQVQAGQSQQTIDIQREIQRGELELARLTQQQRNAIDSGNLQLAREIQTRQVALQEKQEQNQQALQQAQLELNRSTISGQMQGGGLTEEARQARMREAIERGQLSLQEAQTMGYNANGQMTEQARATRVQEELSREQAQVQRMIAEGQLTQQQAQMMGYDSNGNLTEAARAARVAEIDRRSTMSGYLSNGQMTEQARAARIDEELRRTDLTEQQRQALERERRALAEQSGFMENGQLTEGARATRMRELMDRGAQMGVVLDPNTGMAIGQTEAARQFNATNSLEIQRLNANTGLEQQRITNQNTQANNQLGLQYAEVQARLAQNPEDYFVANALQRSGGAQNAMGFLRDLNTPGAGANAGFRSAMNQLPQTASMQSIAGQTPQPQMFPGMPRPEFRGDEAIRPMGVSATPGGAPGADPGGAPGADPGLVDPVPVQNQTSYQNEGAQGSSALVDPVPTSSAPSPSLQGASQAYQGKPAAFTTTMHKSTSENMRPVQATGMPPGANSPVPTFGAAQSSMRAPVDTAQQRLQTMQPIFQAGAHKLNSGFMESMNSVEKGLFNAGLKASGMNAQDFDTQYKRSRLQTGVGANQI